MQIRAALGGHCLAVENKECNRIMLSTQKCSCLPWLPQKPSSFWEIIFFSESCACKGAAVVGILPLCHLNFCMMKHSKENVLKRL